MKKWVVTAKRADFNAIGEHFNIDPVIARIMRNRNLETVEEMEQFICGDINNLHSPNLLKDMDKAVRLAISSIEAGEHIRVIGDYDVDGITATYILVTGLNAAGANVDYAIPNRVKDGYGVNENLIEEARSDSVDCIITCDNGIAATDAFELAHKYGMTCIITDHHEVPYIDDCEGRKFIYPVADAIVNPKRHDSEYPYKGICGAMVAYKFICALNEYIALGEDVMCATLQMAGFGTVCDVMELMDENRILVKEALRMMSNTSITGLKALIQVSGLDNKPVSAYSLGFVLGPCVNATGRLEDASLAMELFMCEDEHEAVLKATELKRMNDTRKEMTERGIEDAYRYVEEECGEGRVLVVYLPTLHESLAGIVAGRIREKYYRPVIVITDGEDGLKGSGRSIPSYNMYEELNKISHLFTKFGGHSMAAGISLDKSNLEELISSLNDNCTLTDDDLIEKVCIDVPMPFEYVTERLVENLDILEPFGVGNPKPVFADKDIKFISAKIMGSNRDMARFAVTKDGIHRYELILFRGLDIFADYIDERFGAGAYEALLTGEASKYDIRLDVIYYPGINEFRGRRSLQYIMQDYQ